MWQAPFNPLNAPWNTKANSFNDHVDWASLAKNWIQQREQMGISEDDERAADEYAGDYPFTEPAASVETMDPSITTVNFSDMTNANVSDENYLNSEESYYENGYEDGLPENMSKPPWSSSYDSYEDLSWNNSYPCDANLNETNNSTDLNSSEKTHWPMPAWAVPPPPPPDNLSNENNETALTNRIIEISNFNMPNQNAMTPFNQMRPPNFFSHQPMGHGFPNMWVPIGQTMGHPVPKLMADVERRPRPRNLMPPGIWAPPGYNNVTTLDDNFLLDANRRRQLPAWIREGLEKMEQEKLKQQEKERRLQEALQAKKERLLQQQLNDPSRSKFDSEDEEGVAEEEVEKEVPKAEAASASDDEEEDDKPPQENISEEERQMQLIVKVKQWMTEILLQVTNQEMEKIVERVFRRARAKLAKAPARQLASSSALASLCSLGDESENEEEEEEVRTTVPGEEMTLTDASESEDENTFKQRLKSQRLQFSRRMKLLEERNYQDEILPELTNSLLNDKSSSGELSEDGEDKSIASEKLTSKHKNYKSDYTNKVIKENCRNDDSFNEFNEHTKKDKNKESHNSSKKNKRKNEDFRKETECLNIVKKTKNDLNSSKYESFDTNKQKLEDKRRDSSPKHQSSSKKADRRLSDEHRSSKHDRKRSTSSELKLSKNNSSMNKNDKRSKEEWTHRDEHKHRRRRDSTDHSDAGKAIKSSSHRSHHKSKQSKLTHRSRSRS